MFVEEKEDLKTDVPKEIAELEKKEATKSEAKKAEVDKKAEMK
jgi:hypothetical protein